MTTTRTLTFREKIESLFSTKDYQIQLLNLVGDEKQLKKNIAETLLYIVNKPELHKILPENVFKLILKSYELKIPINSQELCYIVPFAGNYQIIPTARGYKKRLLENSNVKNARAFVVYENDNFKFGDKSGEMFYEYKPNLESGNYGNTEKIKFAVAVINYKNGLNVFEVMSIKQLQTVQNKSSAPNSPAYKDFKEQMYKKIVLKRLLASEPMLDAELQDINTLEHQFYNFDNKEKIISNDNQEGIAKLETQKGLSKEEIQGASKEVIEEEPQVDENGEVKGETTNLI